MVVLRCSGSLSHTCIIEILLYRINKLLLFNRDRGEKHKQTSMLLKSFNSSDIHVHVYRVLQSGLLVVGCW